MYSKSVMLAFVSFLLLGAGCISQKPNLTNTPAETASQENSAFDLSTFQNEQLGFSFEYPSTWGTLQSASYGNYQIALYGDERGIFLAATNPKGIAPGRGGYWGDDGYTFVNQESITSFCNGKDNCSLMTNKNGITMARQVEVIDVLQGNTKATTQYYFYNAGSPYPGVVISSVRLLENTDLATAETNIENLVQSIQFTSKQ